MKHAVLRKTAVLLLAMCLVLGLSLTAFAATGSIALDKHYIREGETVTVTVSLDEAVTNISTLRYDLYFNDERFELVSSEKGDSHSQWVLGKRLWTNKTDGGKYYPISILDSTGEGLTVNPGTVYTLTFKALANSSDSEVVESFELRFTNGVHPDNSEFTEEAGDPMYLVIAPAKSDDMTYIADIPQLSDNLTLNEIVLDTEAEIKSQSWDGDTLNVVLAEGTADETNVEAEFHVSMQKADGEKGDYEFNDGYSNLTVNDCNVHRVSGKIEDGKLTLTGAFTLCTSCDDEEKDAYDLVFTPKTYTLNFTVEGSDEPAPHVCVFDQRLCADKYLKTAAGCENSATYYYSCACGEAGTETFTSGGSLGHEYENGACIRCGKLEPDVSQYTVSLGEGKTVSAGETVEIPVTIGHTDSDVTTYNAFDVTFTYDPAALQLDMADSTDLTITDHEGTLRILRYGASKNVGEPAFTLKFTALTAGETNITTSAALVGISEGAIEGDANKAAVTTKTTGVTVEGYTVNLPEGFTGETKVNAGESYTFTANDKNYTYDLSATMGGEAVTVTDNGDGSFTIANVNGNLVITLNGKTGKTFGVTLSGLTGADNAQYMSDYTATVNKQTGYTYTITATIGGTAYTGYSYNAETGVVTIPGNDITGNVSIKAEGKKNETTTDTYNVTFAGNAAGEAKGNASVTANATYTFTVNKAEGCTYTVTATMGGKEVTVTETDNGYSIAKVTGDLVITVDKQTDLTVEVSTYLELDGKTLFLVKANGTLPEGYAYAYDGTAMFKSEAYNGSWIYLVMVENGTLTAEDAKAKIVSAAMDYTILSKTCDVNGTGKVDVNDAQLVYDLYNTKYPDFTQVSMEKFLKADTTADGKVDVADATAIVSEINNLR